MLKGYILFTFASEMEKISNYIEILLQRHDYVVVPGFGGFVTQYFSARIVGDSIIPPVAVVGFNPLMNVSDGLLAIEISRCENKTFREAVSFVEEEVNAIKKSIRKNGNISFGNLGNLSLLPDEKILFSPFPDNSMLLPANYGLGALYYSTIDKNIKFKSKPTPMFSPVRGNIIRYAAVGVMVLGVFLAAPTKVNDTRKYTANLNITELLDNKVSNNDIPAKILSKKSVTIVGGETIPTDNEKKFHVIVGCMPSQKMAESLCETLKELEYPNAHIVLPLIKTYRVAVESFANENEAVGFMQQFRESHSQYSDAWVLNY